MINKKNILHVWQSHYPPEIRVGKINKVLIDNSCNVTVLARSNNDQFTPYKREINEDVSGVFLTKWASKYLSKLALPVPGNPIWINAIKREIKNKNIEAIIVRDIPLLWNAARASRNSNIKIILDMAEHYPAAMRSWKKYYNNPILKFIVHTLKIPNLVEAHAVKKSNHILVVCDEQKQRIIDEYGYPSDNITVVKNTPDLNQIHFKTSIEAKNYPNELWFGYHGILCADRQLDAFIKGFSIAVSKQKNIKLLIAGGGETELDLRKLSVKLNIENNIVFTGRYTLSELPELYSRCSVGIVSLKTNGILSAA